MKKVNNVNDVLQFIVCSLCNFQLLLALNDRFPKILRSKQGS